MSGEGMLARREVEIEFGDCDPAGIVYYPNYFRMFDTATAHLFEAALGMKKIAWTAQYGIVGIPMVDTGATFLRPCRYGDMVVIESRVTAFGHSRFDVAHNLSIGGAPAATARETRVWTGRDPDDPARLRGLPIPDEVVAALGLTGRSAARGTS